MNNTYDHNAANEKKWSQRAITYDDKRQDYFRFMQRQLIVSAEIKPPATFLDLGCGTGWAVRHVATLLGEQGRFVGIDISKGMIEKARSNSTGVPNVEFYEASADKLPLDNDLFDAVICSNSFHHYLQPVEALKEVKRVLKPNGRVHILDITADDFFIRQINQIIKGQEREHVSFYGTPEYARMFSKAGLKHVQSRRLKSLYPLKVHVAKKEQEYTD